MQPYGMNSKQHIRMVLFHASANPTDIEESFVFSVEFRFSLSCPALAFSAAGYSHAKHVPVRVPVSVPVDVQEDLQEKPESNAASKVSSQHQ